MTGREIVGAALIARMRDGACEWDKLSRADQEFALGLADTALASVTLVAAERGWHLRPDETTEEMDAAGAADIYHASIAAAPEFEWDKKTSAKPGKPPAGGI